MLITLFQRYSELLLRKFSVDFDQVSVSPAEAIVAHTLDRLGRRQSTYDGERPGRI